MDGIEDEIYREGVRAKVSLLGSLEQSPRGNMMAGSMNEARIQAHRDFYEGLFPWREWPKEAPVLDGGAEGGDAAGRQEFLKDYDTWVQGGVIEATVMHSEPPR